MTDVIGMTREGQKQRSKKWRTRISNSLKKYYTTHAVWNKNKEIHSVDTKRRISESCRRSKVGTWNKGRHQCKLTEIADQE